MAVILLGRIRPGFVILGFVFGSVVDSSGSDPVPQLGRKRGWGLGRIKAVIPLVQGFVQVYS